MHDVKSLREDPDGFDRALARRGVAPQAAQLLEIDAARRAKISAAETAQAERNAASKAVGKAKASGDEAEFDRLRALVGAKKDEIAELEAAAKAEDEALHAALAALPNAPLDDVPDGADEEDNVELRRWGTPPDFDFDPLEHHELTANMTAGPGALGVMDFERAAKLSGARFAVLTGAVARLHRAIATFMLDTHTQQNGLTEVWTPTIVKSEALFGTGNLPKFADDLFRVDEDRWLIPTAEVTLTNLCAGEILDETSLPRRYTAWTACYRSEAGSAGRDVSGMLRQH
ncbi:MAG: aminoacyl--tRNA ligase-related protein, partial [Pseudomonadota bacterium]